MRVNLHLRADFSTLILHLPQSVSASRCRETLSSGWKTVERCQDVTDSPSRPHVLSGGRQPTARRAARVVCSHHSQPFVGKMHSPSCPISWLPTTAEAVAAAAWRRIQSLCNCWAELIQRCVIWRGTRGVIGRLRDRGRSITDGTVLQQHTATPSVWCSPLERAGERLRLL